MAKKVLTPAYLMRMFRKGRFMMKVHDGEVWVTDSYLLVRLPEARELEVREWLRLYNLDLEDMTCEVGPTVVRTSTEGPRVDRIIAEVAGRTSVEAKADLVEGRQVLLTHVKDHLRVYRRGPDVIAGMDSKMSFVERVAETGVWAVADDKPQLKPMGYMLGNRLLGVVMPVRLH